MTKTFFTSDPHYFHKNILVYCKRPFNTIEDMNNAFVDNWNRIVSRGDQVYILGDFSLAQSSSETESIIKRLNGAEKHLVMGNHDASMSGKCKNLFTSCSHYKEIEVDEPENTYNSKQLIVLSHYAFRVWNQAHHNSWNLYGHSHGLLPGNSQQLDVGVDCWDYTPCSYEQVKERLATLPEYQKVKAKEITI